MNLPALRKITGAAAAVLLGATSLWAQIEVNPNLAFSGYLVGSARYMDTDGEDETTMDLDTALLMATLKYNPVTGVFSYYFDDDDDPELLDIYITYDLGSGTTLTAGKFLSWHGYEAFHIPSMLQISYANDFAGIIPGYHKGVKVEHISGASKMGVAILDSVYGSDGELDDGFGLEAYYSYSAGGLTAYLGLAYDSVSDDEDEVDFDADSYLLDLWLQYVAGSVTYAAEFAYGSTDYDDDVFDDDDVDSFFWLLLADIALSEKSNLVLRLSGGEDDYADGFNPEFIKGTVAYRHKCSDNFALVYEGSYSSYDDVVADDSIFLGIQGRFTF